MTRINQNSNYWSGNLSGSADMWWRDDEDTKKKGKDLIALAGYRRAIANFVNIVTQRSDVPVTFASGNDSFTDGKTVTLSSNINDKNFDPTVGLALHEGSHIVHSDFDFLKSLKEEVAKKMNIDYQNLSYNSLEWDEFHEACARVKNLLNYVEDRRIDYLTFKAAPGYKNYYHAMYDKYFNFRVVTKALKSNEHRDPSSYDSYEFRIINFTNSATDLNALPGLREIYRTIDLKNISRLESTVDAFNVAYKVYEIIKENLVQNIEPKVDGEQPQVSEENATGDESIDSQNQSADSDNMGNENGNEGSESATDGEEGDSVYGGYDEDRPELSKNEQRTLENSIEKQKKLIDGEMKKSKLTKKDKQQLKAVEESGAYHKEVGTSSTMRTNCIVIPKLTETMLGETRWENTYDFFRKSGWNDYEEEVLDGLRLGTVLGKKLQIRNEEKALKWTRQDSGRIDRRLIAELGFNNGNVFQTTLVEKFEDAYLHVSIDASGSMNGTPFAAALKSAAAMCKAVSMTNNIHIQVSIRTTHGRDAGQPLIAIIYDSKVNKIVHIKKFWRYLDATGTTPEGLCFEAIERQILSDSNGRDAYFLNLSDGMPYFQNSNFYYSGDTASNHTRNEVDKLKKAGIKILSFFVTESSYGREKNLSTFKKMYGQDAKDIDVTSVVSLAKVLNAKFLEN